LGRAVFKELNQAALSLKADGRALNLTEMFVPLSALAIGFLIAINFNKADYKSAVYKLRYNEIY
jgi:hypothetical protein